MAPAECSPRGLSTHVPPAPPDFTYAKQFAKPHRTASGNKLFPCTCTKPPPAVEPLAGVTVDTFGCDPANAGHNNKHTANTFLMPYLRFLSKKCLCRP